MKTRIAVATLCLLACSKSSAPSEPNPSPSPPAPSAAAPAALPAGHTVAQDTAPKEGPRLLPAETLIRSYLMIFGGLAPLQAQTALRGQDGQQLFDAWSDYLGTLGMPDYRYDTPRMSQTNALMLATFERIGIALCDRALEHDRSQTPRVVFDFDIPSAPTLADFTPRFDVMHRVFLNYPAAMAPTDRVQRFWTLYQDTVKAHAASRFSPPEAGWAAVCYGLVRHPEFHLY